MSYNAPDDPPGELRHRIEALELKLHVVSQRPVMVKIFVDEVEKTCLLEIKPDLPLRWDNIVLRGIITTSHVKVLAFEKHYFRRWKSNSSIGSVEYVISTANQREMSILSDTRNFIATFTFPASNSNEQALNKALHNAKHTERPTRLLEKLGLVRDVVKTILDIGSVVAELHPIAKVVYTVCEKAWKKLEAQADCDEAVEQLVEELSSISLYAQAVKDLAILHQLKKNIMDLLNLVEDASTFIIGYKLDGGAVQSLKTMFGSTAQGQVNQMIKKLKSLKEDFDRGIRVQALQIAVRGNLQALRPIHEARYDVTRSCMPGTRSEIIENILEWCQRPEELDKPKPTQRLLWVYGHAGLGKTAVSTSVCEELDKKELLAASFFCQRDSPERRNSQRVLTSIIYGLAVHHETYGKQVAAQIQERPSLPDHSHMQKQYEKLVQNILGSHTPAPSTNRLVIVVDALDECDGVTERRNLIEYLLKTSQLVTWLRIMITSSPATDIKKIFEQPDVIPFSSQDISQYDADGDIRLFTRRHWAEIKPSQPLPEDTIDRFATQANGSFIRAQTAWKFVSNGHNPQDRLMTVLAPDTDSIQSYSTPDSMYEVVLKASADSFDKNDMHIMIECLGAIISCSIRMPLSVVDLCALLGQQIRPEAMQLVVNRLASILYTDSAQGNAVRVHHQSFVDYMTAPERSGVFCVDIQEQNAKMATNCIRLMKNQLRFNICDLKSSYKRNQEVEDLSERVHRNISQELQYSCLYWADHFAQSKRIDEGLPDKILMGRTTLYWIEVLSLIGKLDTILPILQTLKDWYKHKEMPLFNYIGGLDRFIQTFYDAISESTPHLYISALGFLPRASSMTSLQKKYFSNTVAVERGVEQKWPLWLHCISHDDAVQSVAVSQDGRCIISGLSDGSICTWDSNTGAALNNSFIGHEAAVNSIALSPSDRRMVSGSADQTVRLWSFKEDTVIANVLTGHTGPVLCVAFSPNGALIVSGSEDCTLRAWNAGAGPHSGRPFYGHTSGIYSVAFSLDNERIISGSYDRTLLVWDTETGAALCSPLLGHSGPVLSVAFSPDGKYIASGSSDSTIQLWDAQTYGKLGQTLTGHSKAILSIAFSLDGSQIISGSVDKTLRVWSVGAGHPTSTALTGHSKSVTAVVFSKDGRIVSASEDKTVRVWEAGINAPVCATHSGHTKSVYAVAFSPNGRHVASGSGDKTIQQWDIDTGIAHGQRFNEHSRDVCSIAYSPDGHQLASGSADGTIIIRDVQSGLITILEGHSDTVSSVSFSFYNKRLASGSWDHTVRVWDTNTGTLAGGPFKGHTGCVSSVALSADGQRVVSGSWDNTVRVWDTKTAALLLEPFTGHTDQVLSVAFSADNSRIVSGSWDKTLRVWDSKTGALLSSPLLGHSDGVTSVSFALNDHYIVSGSWDKTIRIWDVANFAAAGEPLRGHSWPVRSIALSRDGCRIASGSDDYTIRIWHIDTGINVANTLTGGVRRGIILAPGHTNATGSIVATQIPAPSTTHTDELPSNTFRLMEGSSLASGWIATNQNELLFWIPPEYRRREPDDSYLVISSYSLPSPVWLEYSRFVHGNRWTEVYVSKS